MIRQLDIVNFKRLRSARFRLAPLTVLTGANGTGKSTLIQSLLLIRQAAGSPHRKTVLLNGPNGLAMGEALDVLNHEADTNIEFGMRREGDQRSYRWSLAVPADRRLHLQVDKGPAEPPPDLTRTGPSFTYLGAERLGPRDLLEVDPADLTELGVGAQGEFTAQFLHLFRQKKVPLPLRHPSTGEGDSITLRGQAERWASTIIRPVEIDSDWPVGTSAAVLRFRQPGAVAADWLRPVNIGFGVSYALPIIVAALATDGEGLFLIENPEAHLHPEGQSRIGSFLALLASTGVQVMVETHSDHVLNGVRRAVAIEKTITHEDVVIHFFEAVERPDGRMTRELRMSPTGSLDDWPPGFFDQLEHDLAELSKAQLRSG